MNLLVIIISYSPQLIAPVALHASALKAVRDRAVPVWRVVSAHVVTIASVVMPAPAVKAHAVLELPTPLIRGCNMQGQ